MKLSKKKIFISSVLILCLSFPCIASAREVSSIVGANSYLTGFMHTAHGYTDAECSWARVTVYAYSAFTPSYVYSACNGYDASGHASAQEYIGVDGLAKSYHSCLDESKMIYH